MKSFIFALLFGGMLFSGCKDTISEIKADIKEPEILPTEQPSMGMTTLGKKLENPYSIENMRKALEELKKEPQLKSASGELDNIEIKPTHLYVRFLPEDEDKLNVLKRDTSLVLYDYPLDYEIENLGDYYHDTSLPDTAITWQYAAVEINYQFPDVHHEILSELFILEEEDSDEEEPTLKGSNTSYNLWIALEDKALEITDNLSEEEANEVQLKGWFSRRSKWRPAGNIMVWDDDLNKYIGIKGCIVLARRWFTTHRGTVDENGDYSCDGRFRRDANYSIKWERHHFSIRKGAWSQASYNGPKKKGNWNIKINNTTHFWGRDWPYSQKFYATIFRAAHHYYYEDIKDLKRPPLNSFWKPQVKISAKAEKNPDANGYHSKDSRFLGIRSRIYIFRNDYNYTDIYSTVIHELAHASHWELRKNNWRSTSDKVKESWARGVQWELTRMVYPNYRGGVTILPNYTQVVVDMIDANSRSSYFNTNWGIWNDNVTGYTIAEIEDVLSYTSSWDGWKNNIKNKYDNDTENELDTLFDNWN
ncbi:MAG: hypothetical protein MI866_22245 [Bacteroidales bacterium]|nr:hypothetical protein [Bacteroidales bacterium]